MRDARDDGSWARESNDARGRAACSGQRAAWRALNSGARRRQRESYGQSGKNPRPLPHSARPFLLLNERAQACLRGCAARCAVQGALLLCHARAGERARSAAGLAAAVSVAGSAALPLPLGARAPDGVRSVRSVLQLLAKRRRVSKQRC
jgi:hypothetical protein